MGCDIHCYVEYKHKEEKYWHSYGGRINPGRHYELFAALAGVRDYSKDGTPHTSPRGCPADIGRAASRDWWCIVLPEGEEVNDNTPEGHHPLERATRWVEQGLSVWRDGIVGKYVSDPDLHSASWLTTAELAEVFERVQPCRECRAVLASMRELETEEEAEARLVFWFDN